MAQDLSTSSTHPPDSHDPTAEPTTERRLIARFSRYSATSLVTVPVGYTLLILATHVFAVNAGILNFAISTILTPPAFFLCRFLVWKGGSGRSIWVELFSFWQTMIAGLIMSTVFIALADAFLHADGLMIILAGLTGQGVVFLIRFVWLDRVTFARPATVASAEAE